VSLNDTLNVGGLTTLDSTLVVKADVSLNDTLNVGGLTTLDSTLVVKADVSLNADMFLSGNMGINSSPNSTIVMDISATNAIRLPKGTNNERPVQNNADASYKGLIRYNAEQDQFEGFGAGNSWGSLGGVKDVDQDTYIIAETSAGADNDQLQFYTSGSERMVIDAAGDASFNHGVNVVGATTLNSTLVVGEDVSFNANMSLGGNIVIAGNLTVSETNSIINTVVNNYEVIITNDLSLNGDFIASGDVSLNSTLNVTDATTLSSTLSVADATTLASTLEVSQDASFNNNMYVEGTITLSGDVLPLHGNVSNLGSSEKPFGTLFISNNTINFASANADDAGSLSFSQGGIEVQASGEENVQQLLSVVDNKVAIGKASKNATSNLDLSGTMLVTGDVSMNTAISIGGAATLSSTLDVTGIATMLSNLALQGELIMSSRTVQF
jgi:predicted acyltransferase (DUF342 family)